MSARSRSQGVPTVRLRLTRSEVIMAVLWFVLWLLSAVWAANSVPQANAADGAMPGGLVVSGIGLLAISLVGVVVTAAWLAVRGRWSVIGLLAIYVSGLFFAWYLAAMLSVPVPEWQPDNQDNLAAVGLVFLAVPTAIGVGFLACLGTVGGAIARAIQHRRAPKLLPV